MEQTDTKRCSKCGVTKALAEFTKETKGRYGRKSYCKVCSDAAHAEWRSANRERIRASANRKYAADPTIRIKRRVAKYGLTDTAYQHMLESQYGVCAVCYRPNSNGKPLFVDHCHETGKVRSLLCQPCNFALGQMQDSPDRLRSAAAYLDRHRSAD